jgi:hypothetical protein
MMLPRANQKSVVNDMLQMLLQSIIRIPFQVIRIGVMTE